MTVSMVYDFLHTEDLRGFTQADYLISMDARFSIIEGDSIIYDEPAFPVVELARSLQFWLSQPHHSDFEFESMSFEEPGAVFIRQAESGWQVGSIFTPSHSSSSEWLVVDHCCANFVRKVVADLRAMGVDPARVLGKC